MCDSNVKISAQHMKYIPLEKLCLNIEENDESSDNEKLYENLASSIKRRNSLISTNNTSRKQSSLKGEDEKEVSDNLKQNLSLPSSKNEQEPSFWPSK